MEIAVGRKMNKLSPCGLITISPKVQKRIMEIPGTEGVNIHHDQPEKIHTSIYKFLYRGLTPKFPRNSVG